MRIVCPATVRLPTRSVGVVLAAMVTMSTASPLPLVLAAGVAVPVGLNAQGLPLGLQLIGRPWEEGDLLNHAYVLERAAGFVSKPKKWW